MKDIRVTFAEEQLRQVKELQEALRNPAMADRMPPGWEHLLPQLQGKADAMAYTSEKFLDNMKALADG